MQITPAIHTILGRPGFAGAAPAPRLGALDVPNPELDPLVQQQARFRVDGSGAVSQRRLVPATAGALELVAREPAVLDTVRGVLELVEHAAGGAAASAGLEVNGIALANSPRGHGANTYRAHVDDDPVFRASMLRAPAGQRAGHALQLGREAVAESTHTKANVVAGWINVGPGASGALLGRAGIVIRGYNDQLGDADLASAVRVLRHEAQHVADQSSPRLGAGGLALREALAEAHSTTLEHLRPARRILGLEGVVGDEALRASTSARPYRPVEALLGASLRVAGLDPAGRDARTLLAAPAEAVADELVRRIARSSGAPDGSVRDSIGGELAAALQSTR